MRNLATLVQEMELHYSAQVVIPALNEEPGIGLTIAEMKDILGEVSVLVVDGKSSDRTVEIAKNLGAKVLFQDGIGKGDAFAKALEHVDLDIDYVILTDADHTYPAEYIPEMICVLENNPKVGMVCGNRFSIKLQGKAFQSRFTFGNKLLALAHNILNGIDLQDPLTGLRVIRADILRKWTVKSKGFDMEVELNHQVTKQGYQTIEIPIVYRERMGEKKLKMKHGATILRRIMTETLS